MRTDTTFSLFGFCFLVFCFARFLFGKLALQGDARNYYEHFKFFLDNMRHGVYPMWESTRQFGVPAEFFMRRIGELIRSTLLF